MNEENIRVSNCGTDIEEDLVAVNAELEIAKAEVKAVRAESEAIRAEAEAMAAEAEALMAEAKLMKAEAEALMAEAKNKSTCSVTSTKTSVRKMQPQLTVAASQIVGAVSVSSLDEKDKLPKERIVLYHDEYQKFGITNFRATFIKNYSYDDTSSFMVNGEYDGKTKKGLLMVIMVFNDQNEMIGTDFDERIKENIRSHKTYSTSLTLPNNEQISRVEIRIVKDPSSWD